MFNFNYHQRWQVMMIDVKIRVGTEETKNQDKLLF